MQLFPKSHKRIKTKVPLKVMVDEKPTLVYRDIVGIERIPFIIHRKAKILDEDPDGVSISRDKWTVPHVFSGYAVGVYGSYEYCSAVANELFDQPILYLPTPKMMTNHPDFQTIYQHIENLKDKYYHLGGQGAFGQ